jgi:hypothetical protein
MRALSWGCERIEWLMGEGHPLSGGTVQREMILIGVSVKLGKR